MYKIVNSFLFLCLSVFFITDELIAGQGFVISPSRIEGKMPAGKKYEECFTIKNTETYPVTLTVEWKDKSLNPLTKDWFKLEKNQIVVPENDSATIKFTISPPVNSVGELDARVIFTKEPPKDQPGVGISMRYNFPVYVIISGTEKYDFEIKNIEITNKEETRVNVELYNTGNVHIRPSGTIDISKLDGTKYTMDFDSERWAIIPRESYIYSCAFTEKKLLAVGKYKATINIESGESDNDTVSNMKKISKNLAFEVKADKVIITQK